MKDPVRVPKNTLLDKAHSNMLDDSVTSGTAEFCKVSASELQVIN